MADIKPLKTVYKGCTFRSTLEARWAVFFDNLGVAWTYNPEGYTLPNGKTYFPDFKLSCWGCRGEILDTPFDLYIEVSGVMLQDLADKIYSFCGYSTKMGSISKHPVLVLGNMPTVSTVDDVSEPSIFNPYDEMNSVDIHPFNYETIDGDCFGAYPASTKDGKFYLFGDDSNYVNREDCDRVLNAYKVAKTYKFTE